MRLRGRAIPLFFPFTVHRALPSGLTLHGMTEVPAMKGGPRRPPKLDLRAFQSPTSTQANRRLHPRSLLDSHIHLWTRQQLGNGQMAWPTKPGGVEQLRGAHEMRDYDRITRNGIQRFAGAQARFSGVVFVQAEYVHVLPVPSSSTTEKCWLTLSRVVGLFPLSPPLSCSQSRTRRRRCRR